MNWLTVVESIGIFGVGSGILAALIRSLVKHALDRDLEAFKHGLRRAHEIEMEEAKNRFTVGATSHMANVAFDKHVEFSEKYVAEVFETLKTMFRQGPHKDALKHTYNLAEIRRKWAVWLTPEIEAALKKFEDALGRIGADAHLLEAMPGEPGAIKEMFAEFANVFGPTLGFTKWEGIPVTQEYAIESVIDALRKVLGIAELTQLRGELVVRATGKASAG